MRKPYKTKSLKSAEREVRKCRRLYEETIALLDQYAKDRKLMAMLAAEGPCFDNPLVIYEAKRLRDQILKLECQVNPDGTFLGV